MGRRELLRLLSIMGALIATPAPIAAHADDIEQIDQFELLNSHLWQVFALSPAKRAVHPAVREQLGLLTAALRDARSHEEHVRLCVLAGDLLQLAGEIMFDANRYVEAAHCYKLAADASKEGGAFDQWACALTRHAYVDLYEREYGSALDLLDSAERVAGRGDGQLPTRYWVAAVRAEVHAGLGELGFCERALGVAERVGGSSDANVPGGWLRFDGTRLAEQRGTCYAALGRPELASGALGEALGVANSLRRKGSILVDLAGLGVRVRDLDQVLEYGAQAIDIADRTRSSGYVGRKLRLLRAELGSVSGDTRIAQLVERIDLV
ncbi:hypothetical protein [Actinomadura terrae]|uniref:hypothetical protein n=1 Tax=Actinomadura terrae TaxID=604353 RepID=UPI001FA7F5AF|nr:hypothetical protein [Actinomadura terrae]